MMPFSCNSDDPSSVCLMTLAREAASFAGSSALLSQMSAAMERGELDPVAFARACDDYADKPRFGARILTHGSSFAPSWRTFIEVPMIAGPGAGAA